VVGAGFLASHLAAGLAAAGARVTVLARSRPTRSAAARIAGAPTTVGDASDRAVIEEALDNVDQVVWAAGGLLPADSNRDPISDVQLVLPPLLTVLEALRLRPHVRIALLSSGGTVYGNPMLLPVPESHPTSPLTSHGVMKLAAEHYLCMYEDVFGVPALILRCGNVFGEGQPDDRSQGLIAAALRAARTGQHLPVFGDGSAERDYLHVGDLVDVALGLLHRSDVPRVINVGSGRGTTVTEVIDTVEAVTGAKLALDWHSRRPGDVSRVVLDTDLLLSLMDFDPLPLRDGIELTWAALVESEPSDR
jgi:UDP-glucose 4-epimerase